MTQLLTIAEVATRLRVSRQTVYHLVESGKLGAYRVGIGRGALRVEEAELERFLHASRSTPPAATVARPYQSKPRQSPLRRLGLDL